MKWSRCRPCGAPIIWARTEARGKAMPLDVEPTKAGNVEVVSRLADGTPVVRVVAGGLFAGVDGGERYMPHHATCPKWGRR